MKTEIVWAAMLDELELQMTQATFDTWLRDSRLLRVHDDTLTIGVKSQYARDWLEHRLLSTIQRTASRMAERPVTVEFEVLPDKGVLPAFLSAIEPSDENVEEAEVAVEAVYGSARKGIMREEHHQIVTDYDIDNWLPELGPKAWAIVKILRRWARAKGTRYDDGTARVRISFIDLAAAIGMDRGAITRAMPHEPFPGQENENPHWRRIVEKNKSTKALRLFIPKLRLWSRHEGGATRTLGYVIYIRMDDPIHPKHAAEESRARRYAEDSQMEQGQIAYVVRDGQVVPLTCSAPARPDVGEIVGRIKDFPPQLTMAEVTTRLDPIIADVVTVLDDEGSEGCHLAMLKSLYQQDRLDVYLQALDEALSTGVVDRHANLGAVLVKGVKRICADEALDTGLSTGSRKH